MNSAIEIRRIAARDTIALRDAVLRPHLPPGSSIYPGDDAADTLHLGAFENHRLVAVATVGCEAMPGMHCATSWRLRGMAALLECRGHGLGKELAQRCIAYATEHRGTVIWCTSRITTVRFYRKFGFLESGDTFTLPQHSDALYVRMVRPLP